MELNQEFIRKLRNGEIAVENNGTVEQLREVLKEAFPKDKLPPGGTVRYYKMDTGFTDRWNASDSTSLPIISVTDFYQPELFTGWAKSDGYPNWMVYFKEDTAKFGFNVYGEFDDDYSNSIQYSLDEGDRPATHEEVEKHLIQEAIKRGYKKGVTCLFGEDKDKRTLKTGDIKYKMTDGGYGLLSIGIDVIFSEKEGQWAEIVDKPQPNPIHYTVEGITYSLNYQELKAKYESVVNYSDEQFMGSLPEIAHLACIISYFKGLGVQATISDKGIIHELIHLMTDPDEPTNDLAEIREKFNKLIQLV